MNDGPWNDYAAPADGPWNDYPAESTASAPVTDSPVSDKQTAPFWSKENMLRAGQEFDEKTARGFDAGVQQILDAANHASPAGPIGNGLEALLGGVQAATSALGPAYRVAAGEPLEKATGIPAEATETALELAPAAAGLPSLLKAAPQAAKSVLGKLIKAEPVTGAAEAAQAGYVLPPIMQSKNPSFVSDKLSAIAGKAQTAQAASIKNQEVTNNLAARAIGLDEGTTLTPDAFSKVRQKAGEAYNAVRQIIPSVKTDEEYQKAIAEAAASNETIAGQVPSLASPKVSQMAKELSSIAEAPTDTALEVVKSLRKSSTANLQNATSPDALREGYAQKKMADALDDLIERNLEKAGDKDAVKAYKDARQQIAKSYAVQGATNVATGDVNARALGGMLKKGKPLTGELETIAKTGAAFPKATQSAAAFGGAQGSTAVDAGGAAYELLNGRPYGASAILGRPLVKSGILSAPYQKAMMSGGPEFSVQPLVDAGLSPWQIENYAAMLNGNAQNPP